MRVSITLLAICVVLLAGSLSRAHKRIGRLAEIQYQQVRVDSLILDCFFVQDSVNYENLKNLER